MRMSMYDRLGNISSLLSELTSYLLLMSLLYHFALASFRDPGIIKRNSNELETNTADNSNQDVAIEDLADPVETGMESDRKHIPRILTERYCDTCCTKRPPLASHCRQCNHCVRKFDQ